MAAMDVSAQQRVVAVGASAGGVKALIRLAAALPSFAPKSLPVNDIDSTDAMSTSCADASSCTATPCRWAARSLSAP